MDLTYHANKEWRDYDLKLIGVMGKNREEWVQLDYANILYKHVMVPFYDVMPPDHIEYILESTGIKTVFISGKSLEAFLKAKKNFLI